MTTRERREERGLTWRERRGGGLAGALSRDAFDVSESFLCIFRVRDGAVRGVRRRVAKQSSSLLIVGHANGARVTSTSGAVDTSIYLPAGCTFERSPPVGLASTVESSFWAVTSPWPWRAPLISATVFARQIS